MINLYRRFINIIYKRYNKPYTCMTCRYCEEIQPTVMICTRITSTLTTALNDYCEKWTR